MPKTKKFRRSTGSSATPAIVLNRPSKRKQWQEDQMLLAMETVSKGMASANKAATMYGVPRSTLKDRLSGRVTHGTKPGPRPYLQPSEERELTGYLRTAAEIGYGKTRQEVKSIAEKVARGKGMLKKTRISNGWWRRFLERNPTLRLRQGDSTAAVRMDAVSAENVGGYYALLREIYDEFDFENHPERIYNMDETGMPLDPHPPKVVAAKGQKKVRYRSSGNKSQITVVGCGSATGQPIPPFIIFAAKQLNELWTREEVSGSRYAVSNKGWIDQELFSFWLHEHFLSNAIAARPLLLLLDGHSSHYEPTTLRFAKENDIIIFCLPPHTTHECQPLDCSLFGPLKLHWRQAVHDFYQKNSGRVISKLNFCSIFRIAWLKAVTPDNICAGFRKAGVFPYNPGAVSIPGHSAAVTKSPTSTSGAMNHKTSEGATNPDTSATGAMNPDTSMVEPETSVVGATWPDTSTVEATNPATSACETMTASELGMYERRYAEGYDIYDAGYTLWLKANHPEALPSVLTQSSSQSSSSQSSSSVSRFLPPLPASAKGGGGSTKKKTGARVLTRAEILAELEEKAEAKRKEAEDKEKRKKAREEKKKQREADKQRKAEERAKKVKDKARKEKVKKVKEKARKIAKTKDNCRQAVTAKKMSGQTVKGAEKRLSDEHGESTRVKKMQLGDIQSNIDTDRCCACFTHYNEDIGTGREWLQCHCGRWIHEDCIEEYLSPSVFCPLCLSSC